MSKSTAKAGTKARPPKPFKEGDKVSWISQARGSETWKTGTVVAVVPAGAEAPAWPYTSASLAPRRDISYIIHVPGKTEKGQGRHYRPLTKNLKKA